MLNVTAALAQAPSPVADSSQAVRNLFQQRRTGGGIFTAIGIGATGAIARGLSSGDSGGNAGGAVVSIAALGGVPAGIGISKLVRFSKTREEEIIAAHQQGKPVPNYVRRRLKAKHFAVGVE
ncbi:hypothetical protein KBK19_13055 [Microvirga sp. STR05]|uniref:Uncharacterized protein n=1 Tax=Hymenobacter duratus TaxID=2771356 RepID=A0ABR8JMF4_9BACT|nr:hypothetical protein [Hymenobacter duratus]MBD2715964.1 hypothetical protein [Hymenobacter duratus]MBR7950878.1 hypothetical protein [Microvirga sp. STR05]